MNTSPIDATAGVPCETSAQSDGNTITKGNGFSATSYRHRDFGGLMDPLILVDHFVMTEPTFGTHPHAGLSAVTVMFQDSEGAFRNRDSLGNDVDLAPGDLYWFKAGSGAVHNEEPRPGARTHALQVFVGLSAKQRRDAPAAFHIRANEVPLLSGVGSTARLLLGDSNGVTGAPAPDTPLTLLDIDLKPGGRFLHRGMSDQHAWILAVRGTPTVSWNRSSTVLQSGTAIAFTGATDIAVSSAVAAHVVLFRGKPLRETFIQRGPFAMGTEAEIDAVEAAYRAGRLGSID